MNRSQRQLTTQDLNKELASAEHPAHYLAAVKLDDVKENIKAMWNMPYPADPILEPDLVGLTFGRVILFKQILAAAKGEGMSVDRLLNRMIGMPVQVQKTLSVQTSYQEYLDQIAKQEGLLDEQGNIVPEGNFTTTVE